MQFGKKKNQEELNRHRVVKTSGSMPTAFSYHAKRGEHPASAGQGRAPLLNPDNKASQKSPKHGNAKLAIGLVVLIFAFIIAGLWSGSNTNLKLIMPDSFAYMPHSMQQYKEVAAQAINSSLYNHFKITVSTDDISTFMKNKYPEIEYVAVTEPLIGTTPTIEVQLQRPVLVYATGSGQYLVDSSGIVVGQAASVTNPKQLSGLATIYNPPQGQLSLGEQVLTGQNVSFIETVASALKLKGVAIAKMSLLPAAEELDVSLQGKPYYIKFNLYQNDALQQVGTYLATIATLSQQNKTPTQYIDVRVDGRAYYK